MDGIRQPVYRWPKGRKAKDASPVGVAAWVTLDAEDVPLLHGHRWYLSGHPGEAYVVRTQRAERGTYGAMALHREVLGLPPFPGRGVDRIEVDHLNGDRLDNRKANLRVATHAQNMQNQKLHVSNTSGHRGVSWDRSKGKWCAYVWIDGKHRLIGRFVTKGEAALAAANFRAQHMPFSSDALVETI